MESGSAEVPDFLDVGKGALKIVALELEVMLVRLWLGWHNMRANWDVQSVDVCWLGVDGAALGGEIRGR